LKDTCLVIEDEPAIRRLIGIVLQGMSCGNVRSVGSAEEALQLLEESDDQPHMVITDVRLPGISGVELTRIIKNDPRYSMPVLIMTAFGEPRDHGGDAFLAKPFDVDQFEEFVEPFLQRA
jgi:CheY-like chemotaxis protein